VNNKAVAGIIGVAAVALGVAAYFAGAPAGIEGVLGAESDERPEVLNGSEAVETKSSRLDFQGSFSGTETSTGGLVLERNNTMKPVKVTEGDRILSKRNETLFITRGTDVYRWEDGEAEPVDISASYGSVTGTFFGEAGAIYANQDRDAMFYSFEDRSERKLASDVLVVKSIDGDGDTMSDGAEITLMNRTKLTYNSSQAMDEVDWDGDGYDERTYTKRGVLFQNDPQDGEQRVAQVTDYLATEAGLYYSRESEIYRAKFQRQYRSSGTYTSDTKQLPEDKNRIAQIIARSSLNGGSIQLTLKTGNSSETYSLKEGFTSVTPEMEAESYALKAEMRAQDTSESPVLESIEVRTAT
jgi:hypothetical protein